MQKQLVLAALIFAPFLFSCKKTIQEKKEDIIMAAIVTGRWYVAEYKVNTTDVTPEFAGYEFQFNSNGNVDGIKSSSTTTGTWNADGNALTITAAFPVSAGQPLTRLNGVWKWTDSDFSYIKTYYISGSNTLYLTLRKK